MPPQEIDFVAQKEEHTSKETMGKIDELLNQVKDMKKVTEKKSTQQDIQKDD